MSDQRVFISFLNKGEDLKVVTDPTGRNCLKLSSWAHIVLFCDPCSVHKPPI